jgi:hypothetical protein
MYMASPEYVKWLLLNPDKIETAKQRYPFMARFIRKYIVQYHSQWFTSVKNYECYFCGQRFNSLYALKLHLARTNCAIPFLRIVRNALLEWDKFEALCEKLKHRKRKDAKQILLKLLDDDSVKLEDIYMFCRENS